VLRVIFDGNKSHRFSAESLRSFLVRWISTPTLLRTVSTESRYREPTRGKSADSSAIEPMSPESPLLSGACPSQSWIDRALDPVRIFKRTGSSGFTPDVLGPLMSGAKRRRLPPRSGDQSRSWDAGRTQWAHMSSGSTVSRSWDAGRTQWAHMSSGWMPSRSCDAGSTMSRSWDDDRKPFGGS
jgi:hypothetical protein